MATQPIITTAKGTTLKMSTAVTGSVGNPADVYGPNVQQVRSITGPTVKPKIVDVTTHDTPGFWARKMTVLIEGGDISFEANFAPSDPNWAFATGFWNQMVNLTLTGLQMNFPNGFGLLTFQGYVSQHEFSVPVDNVLAIKLQIAITDNIEAQAGVWPVP